MISKEDFNDWRSNAVTKELFNYIKEQVDLAKETLGTSAGTNPLADRDLVGGVTAFRDVLEWVPEFEPESDNEENSSVRSESAG